MISPKLLLREGDEKLSAAISKSKILVVGAGGIGCEILKNLCLSGFSDVEIVIFWSIFSQILILIISD